MENRDKAALSRRPDLVVLWWNRMLPDQTTQVLRTRLVLIVFV